MKAGHTSEGPAGTDPNAKQNTDGPSIAPAYFLSNAASRPGDDQRQISTLIAALALRGHTVHRGAAGDFLVSRWGLSRNCDGAAALRQFALVLGVQI